MPSEAVAFLTALSIIGGCILLYPLVRALAERIRGGGGRADSVASDEFHGLREDVVQDAQQTDREIAELSERVEFLERFIAKQREAERLPPVR